MSFAGWMMALGFIVCIGGTIGFWLKGDHYEAGIYFGYTIAGWFWLMKAMN
jgi:hypothetical protein